MRYLINLGNKINIIHSVYTIKLSFYAKNINISIKKIDRFYLNIFKIIIENCLVKNKLKKANSFKKSFCWLILV